MSRKTEQSSTPAFIACCARSGSTLLRYALDTHPEIACPPELHLLRLTERLAWTYSHCGLRDAGSDPMDIHSGQSLAAARANVDDILAQYLQRCGKRQWVEKSISSVDHLGLMEQVFPDARVIFLYRAAPGVMGSCHALPADAAEGFEFDQHLAAERGNPMDGLARYWLEKTDRLLAYQQHIGERGFALRYEDLVLHPAETLASLFEFLNAAPVLNLHQQIFNQAHQAGPGDPKIQQTNEIEHDPLTRGQELPWGQLSARRRRQINGFHRQLGYPEIHGAWNPSETDYSVPIYRQ